MFGSCLVTIAVQMCLIFGCELWPKAPGKFWNWTGKLLEFFSSKRVGTLTVHICWILYLLPLTSYHLLLCSLCLQALHGGQLHHGHFEMIRIGINKKLEQSQMFAVWRIEPPWKPVSRKGIGHKMGGGKGSVDHYVTPVKAGRIIIEVAGECEFSEVFWMLVRDCGSIFICCTQKLVQWFSVELWGWITKPQGYAI